MWLIHQHRTAYELWDHPDYADLSRQDDGSAVRDMVWNADRLALNEAKRVFTNSKNVRDRLWSSLRIPAEAAVSPVRADASARSIGRPRASTATPSCSPAGWRALKRQSLVIDAMAHVKIGREAVLVGKGPDEPQLRAQIERLGAGRPRAHGDRGLATTASYQLYDGALAVYYGPFDEDYGYVTLEGFAAERPVVTLTRQRRPARVRASTARPGWCARRSRRPSRRRSTDSSPTARRRGGWGGAGNALVRAEVPRWPDVVARLLD